MTELHQKDLRINSKTGHILGPEIEVILEADTFLALSLIVEFMVSGGSYCRRRVDNPVIRPCKVLEITQFLRI